MLDINNDKNILIESIVDFYLAKEYNDFFINKNVYANILTIHNESKTIIIPKKLYDIFIEEINNSLDSLKNINLKFINENKDDFNLYINSDIIDNSLDKLLLNESFLDWLNVGKRTLTARQRIYNATMFDLLSQYANNPNALRSLEHSLGSNPQTSLSALLVQGLKTIGTTASQQIMPAINTARMSEAKNIYSRVFSKLQNNQDITKQDLRSLQFASDTMKSKNLSMREAAQRRKESDIVDKGLDTANSLISAASNAVNTGYAGSFISVMKQVKRNAPSLFKKIQSTIKNQQQANLNNRKPSSQQRRISGITNEATKRYESQTSTKK